VIQSFAPAAKRRRDRRARRIVTGMLYGIAVIFAAYQLLDILTTTP
jgi:hypothetical protein